MAQATTKGTLIPYTQRNSFNIKLLSNGIVNLAGHPEDPDQFIALFVDGSVQGFIMEQNSYKKTFTISS